MRPVCEAGTKFTLRTATGCAAIGRAWAAARNCSSPRSVRTQTVRRNSARSMRRRNAAASLVMLCGFALAASSAGPVSGSEPARAEEPPAASKAPAAVGAPAAGSVRIAPASTEGRPPLSPAAIEFIAAMQRVRMNLPDAPDSAVLKAYPIYDYLIAARLRRDLAFTSGEELDGTIDAFLRSHESQPVARSLRHQWLASLAQRRRWDWFLPRSTDVTDPALVCDRLAGRLATGDTANLAPEALARWSLPQRQPIECEPVTAWLRSQGLLTPAQLEARARAALGTDSPGLAREFVAEVPAVRAAPLNIWLQLLESPKSSLTTLAMTPQTAVEPDALIAGFTRLSNTDAAAAETLLPLLLARPDNTATERSRLQRAVRARRSLRPPARCGGAFDALACRTSSTLRCRNGGCARPCGRKTMARLWSGSSACRRPSQISRAGAIGTRAPSRRQRARKRLQPLFAEIAGLRDYYGYLAADRLNRRYNLNIQPVRRTTRRCRCLAADPGLIRAHALFDCDFVDDAAAEWNNALASVHPRSRYRRARLASRWGWYAEAIATLAQADTGTMCRCATPGPIQSIIAEASAKRAQVPARLDPRDHASREPVSEGRGIARRRTRPHADATGDGRGSRAALAPANPEPREPVRSGDRRPRWARRTCTSCSIATATNWTLPRRLQRRTALRGTLAARPAGRCGRLDREHPLQRDPQIRAAHPRAHRGLRRDA